MPIVRWEPFRNLATSQDRFNRLLNESFSRFLGDEEMSSRGWMPPVDIYETDDNIVLKAELPGVNPNDVEIRVEGSTLYMKGERKLEKEVKEENMYRVERSYGAFNRTFALPGSVDPDKVEAEYKDGILTLTIPKREESKPKTIKIKSQKAA